MQHQITPKGLVMRVRASAAALLAAALLLGTPVAAHARPELAPSERSWIQWSETPLPGTTPVSVMAGSDGRVWFADFSTRLVSAYDPATGARVTYPGSAGPVPLELVEAADGSVWWSDELSGTVRRLDPATGTVITAHLPVGVHPRQGTAVGDGSTWWGTDVAGTVAHVSPDGLVSLSSVAWSAAPSDIAVGADGRLWMITTGGTTVAAFDPASGAFDEYSAGVGWASALERGSDGAVWVSDGFALVRVDTSGGSLRVPVPRGEYVVDLSEGGPGVILLDSAGRVLTATAAGTALAATTAFTSRAESLSTSPSGVTWFALPLSAALAAG
ncbi:hypothetical protein NY547_16750 [Cnuibacter physcomitrellae]|uniref:Vgb family protein n=1 Tax=Cnuibacter physcomitrellae TaxID=1619308 RepID=UPI002175B98B|nr:hypothetical protein [Cnuibacter physcomitrellae]MCS5498901.1 hypothetical protein [Cnuibacter physcomitrellae]